MKLNWGHKLVIGMITFMLFIVLLVTNMMKQKIDLVESNYYDKGMKYQEELNTMQGADQRMRVAYANNALHLQLIRQQGEAAGTVLFYRPSDESKDFTLPFSVKGEEESIIPLTGVARGLWKVKLSWTDEEGAHALEKDFTF